MSIDPLARFDIHQPLTSEEEQLLVALYRGVGTKRYFDAIATAQVSVAVEGIGATYLRLGQTGPKLIEELLGKQLLPLALGFHQGGAFPYACGTSALAARLGIAVLGLEHSDTLTSMSNLAACLDSLGRAAEALPVYECVLAARERVLGSEHRNTLESLNNLAVCLFLLGRAAEALPLIASALYAREHVLGREHPDTLLSVNNLAEVLRSLGRVGEALPLHERAFDVQARVLGPEHPNTLVSVSNLGECLRSLGRSAEALLLYERTLEVQERVLGRVHPKYLLSVNNLAVCLESLGRAAEAPPLYKRALESQERILGHEHPHTLASVNNLAGCLRSLGRAVEALPLQERAFEACERILGHEHPATLTSVGNLAECLTSLGFAAKALPLHERALSARERVLGHEHPATVVSVNNLAGCLQALGRATESSQLLERALTASERVRGREHPDTLGIVHNLAECLRSMGREAEALRLHERAVEVRERVLGREHPATLASVNNLALCLETLADFEGALSRWRSLVETSQLRLQPGGIWLDLIVNTASALARHAIAGRIWDWDEAMAALSAALVQAIDLQSPEQLEASRGQVTRFFSTYLAICIDLRRSDLIPTVLAARQSRKLAALLLEELDAQRTSLDLASRRGHFQAIRLDLRRLALGLRVSQVGLGEVRSWDSDRTQMTAEALNAGQRAQMETYKTKLEEYQALRADLSRTDPDFAVTAKALSVTTTDLQARLATDEGLLLLFEREDPQVRLALLITRSATLLVPLVDDALLHAGVLSAHWSRTLYTRSGMRRGVMQESGVTASDALGELPATPLARLRAPLREGLWAPLAAHLGDLRRLHVVTHGSFHLLPLHCGAPGGLELCTYPGLIYYHWLRHQDAHPSVAPRATGALGMAVHAADDTPGLNAIPLVHAEARIVQALWPGAVHTDPDLAQPDPPLTALQLAGHGQVDPKDPARANLMLAGGALDLHAVLGAKQHPAVVVLSACTVGRTADDPDGEPLGLVGGFMLRGARQVIASLQPVPDFYMPLLMALFYRSWRDGMTPAQALGDAKQRLSSGHWHADTAELIRSHYPEALVAGMNHALRLAAQPLDPLLTLSHAWLFPPPFRGLHPWRDTQLLADLKRCLSDGAGRWNMAQAIAQCLIDERARLPRHHVDTLCTWMVAFGDER